MATKQKTASLRKVKKNAKSSGVLKLWGAVGLLLVGLSTTLAVLTQPTQDSRSHAASTIQYLGHSVAKSTGKAMSLNASIPNASTLQKGDVLIAVVGSDYAHVSPTPAGWKLIRQNVKNAGHIDDLAIQTYYYIVGTPGATAKFNVVTGRKDTPSSKQPLIAIDVMAFRGVDTTSPVYSVTSKGETTNAKAIECPNNNGILGGILICAYIGDDPGSIKVPTGMGQVSNFELGKDGDSFAIGVERLAKTGATGSRIAAWTNPEKKNGSDWAQSVVLRPAP